MSENKIIAVLGATGAQGGGLVRAILADRSGRFRARAITRNVTSEKARALASAGAEVVTADVDDPASLRRAFEGAYGAFCVTFFWDHFSPEKEYAQAGSMAEAAKQTGVQHVIWSTLEDSRRFVPLDDDRMPTLLGKYKVPHFDAKGEADALFTRAGAPTTFLLTSFYWDNFIYFGAGPKRGPDGKLALVMPMGDEKLAGMASEDIGKCALGIFQRGREFIGKTVGIAGEHLSGAEMAAGLTRALGETVIYQDVPPEVYRGFGFPGADDLGNMFQFYRDFAEYFQSSRSLEFSRSLNPELQTFEQWLAANAGKIPIEAAAG
ncbi:MAG TPA: NmrA/HSCARG family protein [Gemmatimonadales bacterium]|nr:NmrA/HSCARG family protein [Gemmatimonadales bacterium]